MTTMFVQLRGVVYLLVLLQCFVYVACAEDVVQDSTDIKSTEDDVDQLLNKTVATAYERIVNMSGCLSLFEDNGELCEKSAKRADVIAKNITVLREEIEGLEKGIPASGSKDEWILKNKDGIQQNIRDFDNVTLSLVDMGLLALSCREQFVDLGEDIGSLVAARERFLKVHKDKTHEKRGVMKLDERSSNANQTLFDLKERLFSEDGELKPLENVKKSMADADEAVEKLRETLEKVQVLASVSEVFKGVDFENIGGEKKDIVAKKLEEAKETAKQKYLTLVQEELVEDEKRVKEEERSSAVIKEADDVKERTQETQEEKKKEEEAGGEEEQTERAAEEARKKAEAAKRNDNSLSPALVHSSMLLLLLTVLGYTLVC
ncbi:uncharacterized protein TM35_000281950 [Trypanosoma theileri]|uniref:Uncharacterized protein n=1 Tax=Trypanosoma theileri TaxID=67003 RepID=A0A1X0NQM2_9TRYP|nr:uncharacterized protein TM35_000281950 [Trypanosoma theileri]ORC86479.1 hypothetical protein TM35_000281950 [Trypanosoma theileri]